MTQRAGAVAGLLGWAVVLAGAVVALHAVGGPLAPPPLSDPARLGRWLAARSPAAAALAVVRLVALALAWYLLAVSVAGAVAGAVGARAPARALGRALDRMTVAAARRLLGGAVGLSVGVAAVGGPARATPAPAPPGAESGPAGATTGPAGDGPPVMWRLDGSSDAAPEGAPSHGGPARRTWAVRPGEHFWAVAERVLAEAWGRPPADAEVDRYWRTLVAVNRWVLRDPGNADLLFPGQVLTVPLPPPAR